MNRPREQTLRALVAETERRHANLSEPKFVALRGLRLRIDPGVFDPTLSNIGDLLAEVAVARSGERVLDLGTGSGFQALLAARRGASVLALEKQPEGVRCAQANVVLNGLEDRVQVRKSDLFDAVDDDGPFDRILFNFPFVPWKPQTPWQRANFDEGHQLLRRFLAEVGSHIAPDGSCCMTWAELGDATLLTALCDQHSLSQEVLATRDAHGVAHHVLALRPR